MYHNNEEWDMHPLDGNTGQAYLGISKNEKVFFKRNTSPFIAALAAEGITPRLKWTQRTYSGDILTAQEWEEGATLKAQDMNAPAVIDLIKSVHQHQSLVQLMRRIHEKDCQPMDLILDYQKDLPPSFSQHHFFNSVLEAMTQEIDSSLTTVPCVICHGDLNHNNFLLANDGTLYLVDWDNAKLADPLYDITYLLCRYYPPSQWMDWLEAYDFPIDLHFTKRVRWYSLLACLRLIKEYYQEDRHYQVNETVILLRNIFENKEDSDATTP